MAKGRKPYHYLLQFHRQMKNRFPNAHKLVLLWPVLWVVTGICFLWNNYTLRGTSTREVLAMTRKRQHLLQELKLFEKGSGGASGQDGLSVTGKKGQVR